LISENLKKRKFSEISEKVFSVLSSGDNSRGEKERKLMVIG